MRASSTGSEIASATVSNNTSTANAVGIYVSANNTSSITNVALASNTATANTTNGVYIDDDTTGAFYVDMGGGTLGSTGHNEIFGNTGTELRVDLDGNELKAENNWWGVGTGLAGGETTLEAGSTVDANPYLAADPTP